MAPKRPSSSPTRLIPAEKSCVYGRTLARANPAVMRARPLLSIEGEAQPSRQRAGPVGDTKKMNSAVPIASEAGNAILMSKQVRKITGGRKVQISIRMATILSIVAGASQPAHAGVGAIAQCTRTHILAIGQGSSEGSAASDAINNCINDGGVPGCCHFVTSTLQLGNDCIAVAQGSGRPKVAGGDTIEDAKENAIKKCGDDCSPLVAVCGDD